MVLINLIAIGLLAAVAAGPVLQPPRSGARAQPQPQAQTQAQAADTLQAYRRPYEKLFTTPQREPGKPFQFPAGAQTAKARVVCGMVVVPVTPALDPHMVVQSKDATNPDPKMRAIEPRICNE